VIGPEACGMIDNTLVRMIDEMLRRLCKSSAFPLQKTLEVRANRAHLSGLLILPAYPANSQGFRS